MKTIYGMLLVLYVNRCFDIKLRFLDKYHRKLVLFALADMGFKKIRGLKNKPRTFFSSIPLLGLWNVPMFYRVFSSLFNGREPYVVLEHLSLEPEGKTYNAAHYYKRITATISLILFLSEMTQRSFRSLVEGTYNEVSHIADLDVILYNLSRVSPNVFSDLVPEDIEAVLGPINEDDFTYLESVVPDCLTEKITRLKPPHGHSQEDFAIRLLNLFGTRIVPMEMLTE